MDYWLIDNEVIPLESAMMDVTHIDIVIRSCHVVQLTIVTNIVLRLVTVEVVTSFLIRIVVGVT